MSTPEDIQGQPFGRYILERRIALGGMAEIYLARQEGPRGFSRRLVIKRILPHLADDPGFQEMFLDEARLAARLSHPNIVPIFDFGEVDGAFYLAMELVRGPDLRRLYNAAAKARAPLSFALTAKICAGIAEGLHYAHSLTDDDGTPLGIVHRDISPSNVIVSVDGVPRILDFGIAKAASKSHKTQAGTIKGKIGYMPPEQVRGRRIDGRADLYALGVVLYQLVTGRLPFHGEADFAVMQAVVEEPPPRPRRFNADVPEALEEIILTALEKDPEARFASGREMAAELERFVLTHGGPVSTFDIAEAIDGIRKTLSEPLDPLGTNPSGERYVPASLSEVEEAGEEKGVAAARSMDESAGLGDPATSTPSPEGALLDARTRIVGSKAVDREPRNTETPEKTGRREGVADDTVTTTAPAAPPEVPELDAPTALGAERPGTPPQVAPRLDTPTALGTDRSGGRDTPAGGEEGKSPRGGRGRLLLMAGGGLALAGLLALALWPQDTQVPGPTPLGRTASPTEGNNRPGNNRLPPTSGPPTSGASASASPPATASTPATEPVEQPAPLERVQADKTPAPPTLEQGNNRQGNNRLPPVPVPAPPASEPATDPTTPPRTPERGQSGSGAAAAPQAQRGSARKAPGYALIKTTPWTKVMKGSKTLGQTPVRVQLPAGRHTLRLVNDVAGIEELLTLEIRPGETVKKSLKISAATVALLVAPWGTITIDGVDRGRTPMPPLKLKPGLHHFVVENPETGKRWSKRIRVRSGERKTLKIDLR